MKSLQDLLNGKISPVDLIKEIIESKQDLSTPQKRFDCYIKLDWFMWSTQTWNKNYSGISFDAYVKQHKDLLNPIIDNVVGNWIITGKVGK